MKYLGVADGKWLGVPACVGSQIKGPCSRIDLMKKHAGIDVQAMYPAGEAPKADAWTTDAFLKAAEACHKGGDPFGIGLGETSDNVDTVGAFFLAFGAEVVDAKGNVVVKNDNVRAVLEYYKKLMAFLPPDAPAWDDASNNKWLVSGRGALIMNPPSAWAVAKRDAPQVAEQCWTHGFPVGPKGRFAPFLPYYWSIWKFAKNKEAAKSLLVHLSQPDAIEKMVDGQRRLRSAGVREAHHPQDLGRGRTAEGHAVSLPEPAQAPDAVDLCVAGAAEGCPADLHAGHIDQDVRALLPGRTHGEDAGLGRGRARRLHAELRIRTAAARQAAVGTRLHARDRVAARRRLLGSQNRRRLMVDVAFQRQVPDYGAKRKRSSCGRAEAKIDRGVPDDVAADHPIGSVTSAFYSMHLASSTDRRKRASWHR